MAKFICTSEEQDAFNYLNEKIGVTGKRGLFYSSNIGKHRIYRDGLESPQKGLKIIEFSKKEKAEKICAEINEVYGDNFKVEELNPVLCQ